MKFQSCDYSFNCIPNAHENRARVARPFPPRAGDAMHPVLPKREGSGFETKTKQCRHSLFGKFTILRRYEAAATIHGHGHIYRVKVVTFFQVIEGRFYLESGIWLLCNLGVLW